MYFLLRQLSSEPHRYVDSKKLKYATWKLSDEQTRTTHGISFFCWYGQDGARESRDGVSFALNSGTTFTVAFVISATEWACRANGAQQWQRPKQDAEPFR